MKLANKSSCTGCGACIAKCPNHCISTYIERDGFEYPKVNEELCCECGMCERVCPVQNCEKFENELVETYVGYTDKDEVRRNSSSGGAFYLLADEIIKENGSVYGAAYAKDFSVQHLRIDNIKEIHRLQTSKYTQSKICSEIYKNVKNDLADGRWVLFSGTPCQIDAIVKYVDNTVDTSNLILVEIACHGVASPGVWMSYLSFIGKRYKGNITSVNFREKSAGWHNYKLKIEFENNQCYSCSHHVDKYMKLFLDNSILRKSCYDCKSKIETRKVDLTIADAWTVESEFSDFTDDKGVSLVILHSKKGKELFDVISQNNGVWRLSSIDWMNTNKALSNSVNEKNRNIVIENFVNMDNASFWKSIKISFCSVCKYMLRIICDKSGFSSYIRKGRNVSRVVSTDL